LGLNCARPLEAISLPEAAITLAETHNFDVKVIPEISSVSSARFTCWLIMIEEIFSLFIK
jgi:hypothetical protein